MAVFTPVTEDAAAAFLTEYDIGDFVALEPILEGVENTNYRLTTTAGRYVLTLFEKRVRLEDLPRILAFVAHVADAGCPAPRPVARAGGALLGRLCERPATIIRMAPGAWLRDPQLPDMARAGAALGALHVASDDGPAMPPNRFGPAAWAELAAACARAGDKRHAALVDELSAETETLSAAWPSDLPSGPIHADYFPDNVLFHEGEVSGVIDFYFSCKDARAYDLAISLNAWCFDSRGGFRPEASAAFAQGYAGRRPLTDAERAALPLLCRGAAVRFTLTRLHDVLYADANAMVRLKDPEPFAARMRFHAGVADAAEYGL